jgi:hypothetical protein
MTEREQGQRTTIKWGGIEVEASLVKNSAKPKEAAHETRRVGGEGADAVVAVEPMGNGAQAEAPKRVAPKPDPRGEVRRGVTGPDGEFVDLTDALSFIDERTILDGMEVVATVPQSQIPAVRVRDARYITPAADGAGRVLGLIWSGLRERHSAALVRWTKRTNQALGAIVARGGGSEPRYLILLEVEWSANMRAPGARADLDGPVEASSQEERKMAAHLVQAYKRQPEVLLELRDERTEQRADLLEAAREGKAWVPPVEEEQPEEAESLADALAAAAQR